MLMGVFMQTGQSVWGGKIATAHTPNTPAGRADAHQDEEGISLLLGG